MKKISPSKNQLIYRNLSRHNIRPNFQLRESLIQKSYSKTNPPFRRHKHNNELYTIELVKNDQVTEIVRTENPKTINPQNPHIDTQSSSKEI